MEEMEAKLARARELASRMWISVNVKLLAGPVSDVAEMEALLAWFLGVDSHKSMKTSEGAG